VRDKMTKEKKLESTVDSCQCKECVDACKNVPGWFAPGEAENLADNMGISVQELFKKYLRVDFLEKDPSKGIDEDVFVLSPGTTNSAAGEIAPYLPRGTCVFLHNNKCQIHNLGKPIECHEKFHVHVEFGNKRHIEVGLMWNTKESKDKIRKLLGYDPIAPIGTLEEQFIIRFGLS
jgi:hypothetical protein